MNIPWSKWEGIGVTQIMEETHIGSKYHPLNKELFFTGGKDEDIAEMIFNNASVVELLFMLGNTSVVIQRPYGNYEVKFSRRGK